MPSGGLTSGPSGTDTGLNSVKAGVAGVESDAKDARNFTLYIDRLIENQHISTTTITESAEKIKDLIAAALMGAVQDVEIAY